MAPRFLLRTCYSEMSRRTLISTSVSRRPSVSNVSGNGRCTGLRPELRWSEGVVVLNFSDQDQTCRVSEIISGRVLLSTRLDRKGYLANDYLTLDSREGVVISLANN